MEDTTKVLRVASLAAQTLLVSGAEIYRVQDTVIRIIEHYGVKDYNVYILANGFFIDIDEHQPDFRAAIRHVPLSGIHMGQIAAVNQISREICANAYDIDEAIRRLERCKTPPAERRWLQILASGLGAGGFGCLLGGSLLDGAMSGLLGVVLQCFFYLQHRSKYVSCLLGSCLVTAGAALLAALGVPLNFDAVVIGGIMPLVPGVAFTTSINELFREDHLSGTIRLLDAILTATCIAIGVGATIVVARALGGVV